MAHLKHFSTACQEDYNALSEGVETADLEPSLPLRSGQNAGRLTYLIEDIHSKKVSG
jgi:hypothetical protein